MYKKQKICEIHEDIIQICGDIEDLEFEHVKQIKRQVLSRIKKIIVLTAKAKVSGESMENRLQEYYDAITSMGFKRNK